MNYPELIWRSIEIVLQKETKPSQKIDDVKIDDILNAKEQDETE